MVSPVRIAVVGAGAISQMAHLPVLSKLRGAQVVALCDNDRAKARALADRFGIPDAFNDIDDLLDYDQLDAAVVTTPSHLHEPQVLQLLAAGLDVLCERPLAADSTFTATRRPSVRSMASYTSPMPPCPRSARSS